MKKEGEVNNGNVLGVLKMNLILILLILLHVKFAKKVNTNIIKNSMSNLNKHKCYELIKHAIGNKLLQPTKEAKKLVQMI